MVALTVELVPPDHWSLAVEVLAEGKHVSLASGASVTVAEPHPYWAVQMVASSQSTVASLGEEWEVVVGCGGAVAYHPSSAVGSSGALVPGCTVEHEVVRGHPLEGDGAFGVWLVAVPHPWGAEYCRGRGPHLVD